jgi:hypothetical protein
MKKRQSGEPERDGEKTENKLNSQTRIFQSRYSAGTFLWGLTTVLVPFLEEDEEEEAFTTIIISRKLLWRLDFEVKQQNI